MKESVENVLIITIVMFKSRGNSMSKSSTKYILTMGELKRKDHSLIFKNDKGHTYIPIENVKEIYCLNEVTLNSKLLSFIARAGVILHFFDYHGLYCGTYYPKEQLRSGKLVVAQSETYLKGREKIAKAIVHGIAKNIHEVL